jgi:HD superfamily phosphohydrolase
MNTPVRADNKLLLCGDYKQFNDRIYDSIMLSNLAVLIIDTKQFQRLRNLRQLGSCYYIYQNAVHTRFEHSIGTYHLSKILTSRLAQHTSRLSMDRYLREIPQLQSYIAETYGDNLCEFDGYLREIVNIAALCHDIGHGAFSHIFDDVFVKNTEYATHENAVHEKRSGLILQNIIKSNPVLATHICDNHIELLKLLIDPTDECKGFIFQIVSNNINSLDVDKFDYITRDTKTLGIESSFNYKRLVNNALVIDNNIAYSEQCRYDIYNLFHTRHHMHQRVYAHKGVIASQLMISDIMLGIDPILNIKTSILDMDKFCEITDTYIMECLKFIEIMNPCMAENPVIKQAIILLNRLNKHDLYCCVVSWLSLNEIDINKQDIIGDQLEELDIDIDDIVIFRSKIGYVSGDKSNPLDNIFVYKTKDNETGMSIHATKQGKETISYLVGDNYQEYLNIIFYKKTDIKSKTEVIPELKRIFSEYIKDI